MKRSLSAFVALCLAWSAPAAFADLRASSGAFGPATITSGSISTAVTGVTTVLAASCPNVSAPADTSEDTLATITVPANTMGINGQMRVSHVSNSTNSAGTKTYRVHYSGAAGTVIFSQAMTTQVAGGGIAIIGNTGAANSQLWGATGQINVATGANSGSSAVDTTASTTLVITGQKSSAGDAATLVCYTVEVLH